MRWSALQKDQTYTAKLLNRARTYRYWLVLEGVGVGIVAGIVTVLFRIALEKADAFRGEIAAAVTEDPTLLAGWFTALIAAAAVVTLLLRWEPFIGGSGIPQVEGEMQGALSQTWWRVLLAKFIGGILSIGAGLSLGREGPSIQLGAMAGKGLSKFTKRSRTEEKMLLTCGASAGLAAAFNAPFAGVLFSLEELHKDFSTDVLLSTMAASITGDFISRMVYGLGPVFDFSSVAPLALGQYWMVLLLGVALGLVGAFYNFCIGKVQDLYSYILGQFLRTLLPFLLAGILMTVYPAVLGGGHSLVELVSEDQLIQSLVFLFVMKFIFSILSFGSGVPGGIFLPLLVLGAVVGSICSQAFQLVGFEALPQTFVILGMAGLFAAIVRAPVTGIILISEMSGSFSHLLSLSLVALTAYITADLLHSKPVYDILLGRLLRRQGICMEEAREKVLIEVPVSHGAAICGTPLRELNWLGEALIVAIRRHDQELIPHGDTVLQAGDVLVLLCDEAKSHPLYEAIAVHCKT